MVVVETWRAASQNKNVVNWGFRRRGVPRLYGAICDTTTNIFLPLTTPKTTIPKKYPLKMPLKTKNSLNFVGSFGKNKNPTQ